MSRPRSISQLANNLPQFRWINIILGNLKTSLSDTFQAFNVDNYASHHLGDIC